MKQRSVTASTLSLSLSAKSRIAETIRLGNVLYGKPHSGFGGEVIGANGTSFTLSTMSGGMREPLIPLPYETE